MTFHRLLDDPEDDFESALLGSASLDAPSDAQVRRGVLAIATFGGALSASAVAAAGATPALGAVSTHGTSSAVLFAKCLGIGLVAGLVTTGGGIAVIRGLGPSSTVRTERAAPSNRTVSRHPMALAERPAQVQVDHVEPQTGRFVDESHETVSAAASPRTGAQPSKIQRQEERVARPDRVRSLAGAEVEANGSLTEPAARPAAMAAEIAALSRARLALSARSPGEVLWALDEYDHSERTHVLDAEATMLRLEALMQLGQNEEASRLAREVLLANPSSPHRVRLMKISSTR